MQSKSTNNELMIIVPSYRGVATTRRVRSDPNRGAQNASHAPGGSNATAVPSDNRQTKRRQSTSTRRRYSSVRRGSQYHEVHIAMLPDLSGELFLLNF